MNPLIYNLIGFQKKCSIFRQLKQHSYSKYKKFILKLYNKANIFILFKTLDFFEKTTKIIPFPLFLSASFAETRFLESTFFTELG